MENYEHSQAYSEMKASGMLFDERPAVTDWESFQNFANENEGWKDWLFRGEGSWKWEMESTLKRAANDLCINEIQARELGMIRRFKREYRQFSPSFPEQDDYIHWMAIMRHYGAPTRLLDITYSVYVALFFAVENLKPGQGKANATIWCLNTKWLDQSYKRMPARGFRRELRRDPHGTFIDLFKLVLNDHQKKVFTLNPFEMPGRLTRQQGGFLVPVDIKVSFMDNLFMEPISGIKPCIIRQKMCFDAEKLKKVFFGLHRINISRTTLFEDLEGFACSLRMLMTIPEATHSYTQRFS